jgi:long-subunit acyl-CoA synthetase (AMP-forming)
MILPLKSLSRIASAMREGHGDVLNQSNFSSPNFTFRHDWCSEYKIQFRDNSDLIELPEVIERFSREVKEVSKSLSEHEVIKRFRFVT